MRERILPPDYNTHIFQKVWNIDDQRIRLAHASTGNLHVFLLLDAATAVETNIRKSRRHIFILTPQMVHSEEFAYEQEIALHSALIQNESKVILIEMQALSKAGGLQFGELQDSLRHLVDMQGTIKWREDHVANKRSLNSRFWKRVRYHMPVPNRLPKKTSSLAALSAQGQSC